MKHSKSTLNIPHKRLKLSAILLLGLGMTGLQAQIALSLADVTATPVTCNGSNDGKLDANPINGTPPYTYSWSDGQTTEIATGLSPAVNYFVTVTDAYGSIVTNAVAYTVVEASPLTLPDPTITNITCKGYTDGAITVNPSGGTGSYTFLWSNGETNSSITGLSKGIYSVTVTDGYGCEKTGGPYIVDESNEPLVISSHTVQNIKCKDGNTGSITIYPTGGTGPYSYVWIGSSSTSQTATGLITGNYEVTVTDAYSCSVTEDYTLTEPAALSLSFVDSSDYNGYGISCNSKSDGWIEVVGNAGTSPYTYLWDDADVQTSKKAFVLPTGTYHVKVTDANGCEFTSGGYTLNAPPVTTASFNIATIVNVSATPYQISNAQPTGGTFSGTGIVPSDSTWITEHLPTGPYTITYTATDSYGCVASTSKGVTLVEGAGSIWDDHGELTKTCIDGGTVNIIVKPTYTVLAGYFYYPADPGLIIDNGDNSTGHFDPILLGSGTHIIIFEYTAIEGTFSIAQEFTIYDVTDKATIINLNNSYCNYGQSVIITGNTTGGTGGFFGPSVGFTTDYSGGSKAMLDISALSGVVASDTTHTITYVYTNTECGCTDIVTRDITIHNIPELSFTLKDSFNIAEGVTSITGISPSGGIFSGDGIDAVNNTFSPSLAGTGSHSVQYAYTNTYGCSNSLSQTVTVVNNAPMARDTTMSTPTGTAITITIPANDVDGTISKLYISNYPVNGGVKISGTSLTYTPDAGYSGSDTLTWYVADDWSAKSNIATMVIQVKKVYFNITYNLGGGTNNAANDSAYLFGTGLVLSNPAKTCYTFGGWYDNSNFIGTVLTSISTTATGDVTLYAKWSENSYNIIYILNGGTNNVDNTSTYTYGTGLVLSNPTKTGYSFDGWYDNVSLNGTAIMAISTTATGDETLYAKWSGNSYNIIYILNGGTNNVDNTSTYTYGTGLVLSNPAKTCYTFGGWYDNSSFIGTVLTSISTTATGDETLYAKWSGNSYNIIYILNGGTNNVDNTSTYTYGTGLILSNPTKTGYSFDGWYDNVGLNGTAIMAISTTDTDYKVLFAKWTKIYTIIGTADVNGSISPSGTVSVNESNDQSFTITANSGYYITDVLVDDSSVGAVSSYTFNSVAANHTITASFDQTTGFEETSQAGVALYPNPCENSFILNAGERATILYLYDVYGKLVLSQPIQGECTVNISSLGKGMYIVKIDGRSYKLIKTH